MEGLQRRDKINYYLDLAEAVSQRGTCLRKLYGAVIVKDMWEHPEDGKTALTWAIACGPSWVSPGENGMNCAAASTRKPTPSSALPAGT